VLPWTSGGDGATSAGPPMVPHAVLARQFSWLTIYIYILGQKLLCNKMIS